MNIGYKTAVKEFSLLYPDIEIEATLIPTTIVGVMDPQKLLCGIAGGLPPDVIAQDRFTIADWASRNAFTNLDEYLAREPQGEAGIHADQYYPACWKEALYDGSVYAIPDRTDCRALYYNSNLLIKEGLVDGNGNARPPKTWEELKEYAVRLTKYDDRGQISRIGFLPNGGNSFFYMYSFMNNGSFMSADGRTCTLAAPENVEALEYMADLTDAMGGYEKVRSFESSFQGEALDPFMTGKIAMIINGDWFIQNIARFAPDLEFGVAPPPTPKGYQTVTWSGGFSYAIPANAKNPDLSWKFIQYIAGFEATDTMHRVQSRYNRSRGRLYTPLMPARKIYSEYVFDKYLPDIPSMHDNYNIFLDLMNVSRFRPVTPAGQVLWDEHFRAYDLATHKKDTVEEILLRSQSVVQKELDRIYRVEQPPLLDWRIPIILTFLLVIGLIIWSVRHPQNPFKLKLNARKEAWAGYFFLSPWIFGFLILTAGPIIASIVLSFCEYDVIHPARWLGMKNYTNMFTDDPLFWKSLWNTVYMCIGVPLGMIVGLGIAMLLIKDVKGMSFWRTIFYLPAIIPTVASSILWIWVLNTQNGMLNSVLAPFYDLIGIGPPAWLQNPYLAKPSIIIMGIWAAGGSLVIWLAGLKAIPEYLYESAELDGAGKWSQFRNITLPMLSPYIFFNLIMGIIATFQIFNQAYIMTNGGPLDSTLFYVYHLFNNAFRYLKMGYASAMAWILFIIILTLTLVNFKLAPRWVYYESEER